MASPTLFDLALTINSHHQLAYRSALDVLDHAIRCGEALITARALVPDGQWGKWMEANLEISEVAAGRYMRIAVHRKALLEADRRPTSINGAVNYLRELDVPDLDRRRNGRVPHFDVDEARRLRNEGLTYKEIGGLLGVSGVAVGRQLTPGAVRKQVERNSERLSRRRAEERAKEEQRLDEEVRRVGGAVADAYKLLRACEVELSMAMAEAKTPDQRKALASALVFTYRAEDAITRGLGLKRRKRHHAKEDG